MCTTLEKKSTQSELGPTSPEPDLHPALVQEIEQMASNIIPDSPEYIPLLKKISESYEESAKGQLRLKQMEQILAAISLILIWVDSEDHVRIWNDAAEDAFGISFDHVRNKSLLELPLTWDWIDVMEKIAHCRDSGQTQAIDAMKFTRMDGTDGLMLLRINAIVGEEANHAGYLLLGADITERKFLEQQLANAQKLESIGQLAAGIAHEINTPIQYVGDNTRFLLTAYNRLVAIFNKYSEIMVALKKGTIDPETVVEVELFCKKKRLAYLLDEIPRAVNEALGGLDRIAGIVKAMKEYAHPGAEEKTLSDINKALDNTIVVSRNEWKYVADLKKKLDPSMPLVPCLPGELNQVFLNVIINAAHAVGDANKGAGREKGVIVVKSFHDSDWAYIQISDTGTGIPVDYRDRVFDPFFTSKEVGKGTGQGLAISHNVITEKHQGFLTFDTAEGEGTTFTVKLPLKVVQ